MFKKLLVQLILISFMCKFGYSDDLGLDWENANSLFFDDTDIKETRPGFGAIVLLGKDQLPNHLRDSVANNFLLLKTVDRKMHVTVFQVFLTFQENYDPHTLPSNLLQVFKNHLETKLHDTIENINKELDNITVKTTNEWMILGRDIPSHLAIKVNCEDLDNKVRILKESANKIGNDWIDELSKVLKKRGLGGDTNKHAIGTCVKGRGWTLFIGYTDNKDYKTHVTLGHLKTNNINLNNLIIKQHENINRIISPIFSSERADLNPTEINPTEISKTLSGDISRYRKNEVIQINDEYIKQLYEAGNEKLRFLIEEWGKLLLKKMELPGIGSEVDIKVDKIEFSVINMDRSQNFVAVE